jgi:hypothetical protein
MEPDTEEIAQDNRRRWHVGKEIPIATIIVLILQTVGVIWVAATTFAKVDFMKEASVAAQIVQTAIDKKQDDEAQRSESRVMMQLDKVNMKLDRLIEKK